MSAGALKRLAVDDALPFDVSSVQMEIIDEDIVAVRRRIYNEGLRGSRSRSGDRTRRGPIDVSGTITMNPTPAELDWWLPKILGANEATDVFALADTLPEFQILVDKVGQVHQYTSCKVVRAVFRASAGGPLIMTVEIIGKGATTPGSVSFPAISITDAQPYIMSDAAGALLMDSTAIDADNIQIVVSNVPSIRRNNSQTVTRITTVDREVTFGFDTSWSTDEVAQFNNLISTDEYIPGEVTFTNGSLSILFDFVALHEMDLTDPGAAGRGEIIMPWSFGAFEQGGTKELIVTNVSA